TPISKESYKNVLRNIKVRKYAFNYSQAREILGHVNGNVTDAAQRLGVTRPTFYNYLNKYAATKLPLDGQIVSMLPPNNMEEFERAGVRTALILARGSITYASELLGVSRVHLTKFIKNHGIDKKEYLQLSENEQIQVLMAGMTQIELSAWETLQKRKRAQDEISAILQSLEHYNADQKLAQMTLDDLKVKHNELKSLASEGTSLDLLLVPALALASEIASRVLISPAIKKYMRPTQQQLAAAIAMHRGWVVEKLPGEGKTLAIALTAYMNSLGGEAVRIDGFNDYLVARDAIEMGPFYDFFDLSLGVVLGKKRYYFYDPDKAKAGKEGLPYLSQYENVTAADSRPKPHQDIWGMDIVYAVKSQPVYDALHDNLVSNPAKALLPLRSSGLIIVDEMDSAMVDEASDPLIILPPEEGSEGNLAHEIIERIFKKSEQLIEGQDFVLDRIGRGATSLLSPIQIKELIGEADYIKVERKKIQLEQLIAQALRARYLFKNNVDYIVKANRIVIIDPFTGRLKRDHVWGGYLHEMVSAKEKLRFGGKIEIRGLATYQGDYRRAITQSKLTGISGTLIHVEATLMRDYDLRIMQVNRSVASIVIDEGTHLYESEKEKLDAIVMSVMDAHRNGRPVLIGVDSIESGERIKERLTFEGLDVSVLDGRTTLITERNIIESSGQPGQVTIGTPVIGRGVNVPLSQEAIANGGLKVIRAFIGATQAVDEQIQQRAGRQGQPGSFEVHLSREIDLKDLPSEVRTKELDVSLVRELQHRREDVLRKLKTDTLQYDILLNEWRYIYEQIRLRVIQDMYDPTKPATGELKILLGAIRKAWIPFLNQVMNYRNQLSIEEFERVLRIQFNQSIHEVIDKSVDIHKMQFLNDDFVNALSADWRALQNKLEFDPAKIAQSILNTLKRESNSRMTETEYIEFGVGYEDFRSEVIGQIEGALRVELGGESGDGHLTYQQIVDLIAGRSDRLQMASNTLVTTANPQEIETPPDLQMDAEAMLRLLAIMLIDNSDEYAIQESTLDELQTLIDLYNQLPSTNTPMSVVSLFGLSLKYFINSANYQEYGTHQLFEELSTKLTNIAKKSAQSERLRQVFDQALALSVFLHGSHLHSVMGDAEIDFRILLSNMRYLFAELESGQLDQVTAEMIQTGLARALVFVVPYFEHYPDFDPRGPAEEIESAFPQIIVSVENVQGFRDLIYQNKERIEQLAQDYFEGVKDLTLAGLSIFLYHNGAWGFEHIMGQSLGRLNVSPEILFLRPSHPNWIGNQPELMQELSITQQLAIVFPKPEYAAWDLTYFYQDDLFLKRIQYFEESLNKVDESWSSATRMAGGDAFQMAEEDAGIDAVEIRRRLKENPGQTNDYLLENVHRQHAALRNRRYDPSSLSHDQKQTLIKILMFSLMRLEGLPKNLNWESQAIEAKIEYLAELGLNTAADQLEARAISQKPSIFGGGSDFIGEEILRSFRAQVAFVRAKAHVHRGEYDVAKDIMRESFAVKHLETLVESGFVLEAMEQLRKIFDHRFNWEHYTKQYYEEYALYLLKTLLRANLYQTAYQLLDFFGNPGIELAARNSLAQYQMNQGEVEAAKTLIRELSNPNDLKETRGALQKIERARLLHQLGEADLARDGLRQIQGEIDSNEASDWWAEAQIRLAQVMSEMRIDGADNRIIRVQTYVLGRVLDYNQIYSTEATHLMNYYLANEQYDLAQDFLDQINERWEKRYQDEAAKVRRKFTTNQSQVYVQNRLNEMKNKKLFKHSIWQWMIDRHMANEPPHDALEVSIIIDSLNKYDSSIDAYLEINDTLGIEDVLRVAQKQNDTPHTSRHPSIPFSRYMVGRLGFIPLVELPTYINAWLDGLSKGEADISQADLETLIYWLSQDDESSAFGDVFKRRQRMLQLLEVYLSRQIKNLNLNMEGNRRVAEWRESMRRELVEVRRMDRLKGDNRRKVNFVNELKKRNQNTREFVVQIQPLIHSLGIEKFPSTLWHVLFAHKSQRRLREAHTLLSHADKNPKHAPLIHQLVFANPNRLRGRKQDDYGKRLKLMNVLVEHVLPLYRLIARPGYSGAMQTVVGLVDELMKEVSDVSDMDKRILNIENLSQYIMSQILDEDVRLRHDFEFTDDYMNALFYFSSNKSPELKQLLIIYAREGIDSARTYISNLPGNESYRGHVNWIEGIGAISSRVEMRGSVRDSLESQKEQLVGFMKKHLEELSKQNSDIFKRNGINIEGASYDSIVVWSSEVQNNTSINQTPDYLAIVEHIQHVQGLETTTTYEVSKALSVAMEVDPIVALNLGVGFPSCLNCVNGSLRQYTLATVLDLNKRVIYVKDAKGHRIGRLSIQLTDQGIVPISAIYANSTLDIEPILIRYLFELSKSMNVPIVFPLGRFGKREILAQGDGFIIEVLDNVPIRIEGAFAGAMYSDLTQVVIFDQNSSKEISVPAIVARPKWNAWIQRELNLYDQSTRSAIQGLDDERLQKLMAMMNESHNLKLSGLYINLPTDQLEAWIDGGFSHPNVITHITDERTLDIVPTAPRLAEPRPSRMTQNDDDVERFAFTEEDIAYAKWTLFDEGLAELAMGGFGDLRQDQPMKPGGALYDFEINSSGQQALSEIVNARIKSYDNDDRVEVAPEQIDTDAAILMFEREGKLWPIGIIFSHLGKYSYIDVSEMYRAPSDFKNKMSWSMGRGKQNPAVSETILGQIKTYLINQNKNPSFDRAYALVLSSNIELDDLRRPTIPYRLKTAHLFNLYYLGPHLDGADISLDQLRYPNLEPVFFDPTDQFSHDWQDMLVRVQSDHPDLFQEDKKILIKGIGTGIDLFYTNMSGVASDIFQGAVWLASINQRYGQSTNQISNATNLLMQREGVIPADTDVIMMNVPGVDMKNDIQDSFVINAGYGINFTTFQALFESIKAHLLQRPDSVFVGRISLSYRSNGATLEYKMHEFIKDHPELQFDVLPAYGESEFYIVRSKVSARLVTKKADTPSQAKASPRMTQLKDWERELTLSISNPEIGRRYGLVTMPELTTSGLLSYSVVTIESVDGSQLTYSVGDEVVMIDDTRAERGAMQRQRSTNRREQVILQDENDREQALKSIQQSITQTDELMADLGVIGDLNMPIEIPMQELVQLAQTNPKEFRSQMRFLLYQLTEVHASFWGKGLDFYLSGLEDLPKDEELFTRRLIDKPDITTYIHLGAAPDQGLVGYLPTAGAGLERKAKRINYVVDGVGKASTPDWYRGIGFLAGLAQDIVPVDRRAEAFDTTTPESYNQLPSRRLLEALNNRVMTPFKSTASLLDFVANQKQFNLKQRAIRPLLAHISNLIRTIRTTLTMTSIAA
ncbi:MAG: preprotein translocase subunit SecA/DNA-binding protein Fis, partial [Candidatus Omnitrophota bacterium]